MLYLDASVIVPLLIAEARSATLAEWLGRQTQPLCMGRLVTGEVGSALSRKRRMGELSTQEGERLLVGFDTWLRNLVVIRDHTPEDIAEAALLVRRPIPKLLTPDAIHIATSRRFGVRLVTDDQKLFPVLDLHALDWVSPS